MLVHSLVRLIALAGSVVSAPTQPQIRDLSWTVQSFARTCNDTANSCEYSFTVNKNDNSTPTPCLYNIAGAGGASARTTDYQQAQCTPGSQFLLNQGWDSNTQSITLVVIDNSTNPQYDAFFGYTAAQMVDGETVTPDETRTAQPVGTFSKRSITGAGWTVKNFTRDCDDPDFTCTYQFYISNTTTGPDWYCQIVDVSPTQSSVSQNSWYGQRCQVNGDWIISWGYNTVHDSAVMTVLNDPLQEDAFFGWDSVSASHALADVGPNIVYPLGSFS